MQQTLQRTATKVLILTLVLVALMPLPAREAEASPGSAEQRFLEHINRERQSRGLGTLRINSDLVSVARSWSGTMSSQNRLYHNPNLATQVTNTIDGDWTRLAENVGRSRHSGASWSQLVDGLHAAFMNSSGHRSNILGNYNQLGLGVRIAADGTMWVTQVFMHGTLAQAAATSPGTSGASGSAVPITGDWNGNGQATAGWFDNGRVLLRNGHGNGSADVTFSFGRAGDVPVVGDWNGDGRDSIGIIRGRTWHLRFTNTSGPANTSFIFGRLTSGDYALSGDWNGDGKDTVGIVRNGEWHLRHQLRGGAADRVFVYGRVRQGDVPVTGDWNGDGRDTPAIVRAGEWHIRLHNAGGRADRVFSYGAARDLPVAGDWNADGRSTGGVVRGNAWHLRNHLSGGGAHASYRF